MAITDAHHGHVSVVGRPTHDGGVNQLRAQMHSPRACGLASGVSTEETGEDIMSPLCPFCKFWIWLPLQALPPPPVSAEFGFFGIGSFFGRLKASVSQARSCVYMR